MEIELNDESKFHIVNTDQKMLQDIRKLLIEQNKMLSLIINKTTEPTSNSKPVKEEIEVVIPKEIKKVMKPCKHCGGEHETTGELISCSKKNKRRK